tara:strand:- start:352 stop:750 length:399 start_codon:yes stop_codon:yes gene_type:complete
MANLNAIKGNPRAIGDRVLVVNMNFGEQKTESGLIISSDDGKERGIYPRWGQVYSKGPKNKDPYDKGDWILITHGRWTRGMKCDTDEGEITFRMIDVDGILAYSEEKPEGLYIGNEHSDGPATIDPGSFINQ